MLQALIPLGRPARRRPTGREHLVPRRGGLSRDHLRTRMRPSGEERGGAHPHAAGGDFCDGDAPGLSGSQRLITMKSRPMA